MSNPTTIIDAFLAKGAQLFRERPFGPLPSLEEPPGQLPTPTLVYLGWLASTDAFINQAVGSTIARSNSPMELVANLHAAFHGEIPGNALSEDALSFTVEYFSPHAVYLSDFFSVFPESTQPTQGEMWLGQERMWKLLDARFLSWKTGTPPPRKPASSEQPRNFGEPITAIVPMTSEAWISRLEMLSSAVGSHESSVAYHDHFYVPMMGSPTDEAVLAVFREFLRTPPDENSLLCAAENFLGEVPFQQYATAYALTVAQLLDAAPQFALDLLDYPGCELKRQHIQQLLSEIRRLNPHRDVVRELAELAVEWNSDDEEPFASVVAAAKRE